jgi:ATP-dependent DNA ligase
MRLSDRRGRLERLLEPEYTGLQLITQTRAIDEAEDWLKLVPGLEGVVAKRCDRPYLAGERQRIKVKKQRTADCAVIGIAGDRSRPSLVLALRHADGLFHHFGPLGSVICDVERTWRMSLQLRQSLLCR